MKRFTTVLLSFALVGVALIADSVELSNPNIGALLWGSLFIGGVALLFWLAKLRNRSPFISLIALIPYLNLLLIPLASLILAIAPSRKSKKKQNLER